MADPYSWAARIGEQGYADKQNAQQYEQSSLMQMFQEEAMRQRQQSGAALDLSSAAARLAMQQPYDIAQEDHALANDMTLRRFYSENPIPRATDEETGGLPAGTVNPDGSKDVTIGGVVYRTYPDGRVETL